MPTLFVTGANRGLGLEFARQYRAAGWTVIATCRNPANATALTATGARIDALDVTDLAGIEAVATRLRGMAIDLVVANAGVFDEHAQFGRIDYDEWQHALLVNALAPAKLAEALRPNLIAGQQKRFVAITSQMASIAQSGGGNYAYRSSKAALNMVCRCLASDLRRDHIAVLALSPGWARTDMGGPAAPLSAAQSVSGMRQVIDALSPARSGRFLDYDGRELPW